MRWASALSEHLDLALAVQGAVEQIEQRLVAAEADLVFVFVSPHHGVRYDELPGLLAAHFPAAAVVGCSGGGVLGDGREIVGEPALSITAARLPEVEIRVRHFDAGDIPAPSAQDAPRWHELLDVWPEQEPQLIVVPDPFSCDPRRLVASLEEAYPGLPKIGGLASGGKQLGGNRLYADAVSWRGGALIVALHGDIELDTLIAQGCRPVGEPFVITVCENNVLSKLDGASAFQRLEELFHSLDAEDQALFRGSLFLGLTMDEQRGSWGHGDFLIRDLLGADPSTGALVVAAELKIGQTVQFHLRDARTSAADLAALLARHRRTPGYRQTDGALLFSCLGRGEAFYGRPDHDSGLIRDKLGPVPLGGFFGSGEIGPVRGKTFLHGYTASLGLFRGRSWN